jgi:hypothetical protein
MGQKSLTPTLLIIKLFESLDAIVSCEPWRDYFEDQES